MASDDIMSGWDLFLELESELKRKNRFFPNKKFLRLFDKIIADVANQESVLAGTYLYRARRNKIGEDFTRISEVGVNHENPANNRASPCGIPYMYLADDEETASAEIRANVNDTITVATFKAKRELKFLTLENGGTASCRAEEEFDSSDIAGFILLLSYSFAKPTHNPEVEYLISQFFSAYCQAAGFDGVRYISSARGFHGDCSKNHYNYVLFDEANVEYVEAYKYKIEGITYDIKKGDVVHLK